MTVAQGEAFDPTPSNIEKHLTRLKLPDGLKVAMLPKTSRGGIVSAVLEIQFGDEKALAGKNAIGSMTGSLLMRGTKNRTRQQIQDEMVKLNSQINRFGRRFRSRRNHPDHRGESDSRAAIGGRDVARAVVSGFGIRFREKAEDRRT